MLNYCTHAIEALTPMKVKDPADNARFREVLGFLHKAVKFELPDNGTLFGDEFDKGFDVLEPELLRLPFPVMALEYPFPLFHNSIPGNLAAPKRIALALDYHANEGCQLAQHALKYCPKLPETGGIITVVISYFVDRDESFWTVQPFGVILPRYAPNGTNLTEYRYGKAHKKTARIGLMALPVIASAAIDSMQVLGPERAIEQGFKDAAEEINALVGLLAALSCSNVKMQTEPAPEKLNKKRVKSGKLPFYQYKVVTVEVGARLQATSREPAGQSGRQSPREHLRRGHIRRLPSGKNIWIQSAIIGAGSAGHIDKTYRMKAARS